MITLAIRNAFVMLIIILIIHFLLKHILYDQTISDPHFLEKREKLHQKEQFSSFDDHEKTKMDCSEDKREDLKIDIEKKTKDTNKDIDMKSNNTELDTEKLMMSKKLKELEDFLGDKDKMSFGLTHDKVKFRPQNPIVDPEVFIKPKEKDVHNFILEGDKNLENSEILTRKQHPSGSFFKDPHIPDAIKEPHCVPNSIKVRKEGIYVDPSQDMNPYNSSIYNTNKGSKFLFQNVGAVNEEEEVGIDEIFRQTQIKN